MAIFPNLRDSSDTHHTDSAQALTEAGHSLLVLCTISARTYVKFISISINCHSTFPKLLEFNEVPAHDRI